LIEAVAGVARGEGGGRRKEGRGRKGRAGEGEGKGEGAGLDSVRAGKSLARFGRVEKRREEEIDASKGG
jgi:hypothetical protein